MSKTLTSTARRAGKTSKATTGIDSSRWTALSISVNEALQEYQDATEGDGICLKLGALTASLTCAIKNGGGWRKREFYGPSGCFHLFDSRPKRGGGLLLKLMPDEMHLNRHADVEYVEINLDEYTRFFSGAAQVDNDQEIKKFLGCTFAEAVATVGTKMPEPPKKVRQEQAKTAQSVLEKVDGFGDW